MIMQLRCLYTYSAFTKGLKKMKQEYFTTSKCTFKHRSNFILDCTMLSISSHLADQLKVNYSQNTKLNMALFISMSDLGCLGGSVS